MQLPVNCPIFQQQITQKLRAKLTQLLCSYLWVVHEPHQAPLLCVQNEVTTQELATSLVLLYVQETADAVLSVHVRHLATGTFPGLSGPGVERSGGKRDWEEFLEDRKKKKKN